MKNNSLAKNLLVVGILQLFALAQMFLGAMGFCWAQPTTLIGDVTPSKQEEIDKKVKKLPQEEHSSKKLKSNISSNKTKEMTSQIFSSIPKGKVVAFVDFTDVADQVTRSSQSVFFQIEPVVIAEGNRAGVSFIERKDLKLILDEWDLKSLYQTEGVDHGAQELLGADYILTGKVLQTDTNTLCTLKLVDLASGKIVTSVSGEADFVKEAQISHTTAPKQPPTSASINRFVETIDSNKMVSEDSKLSLWTGKQAYTVGDKIEIFFSVNEPLYVQIIDITPDGKINVIFPNDSQKDSYCLPGEIHKIPPENSGFELLVTPPRGVDRIKAIASPTALDSQMALKTRGIQFTKTLVNSAQTRVNLSIEIQ